MASGGQLLQVPKYYSDLKILSDQVGVRVGSWKHFGKGA